MRLGQWPGGCSADPVSEEPRLPRGGQREGAGADDQHSQYLDSVEMQRGGKGGDAGHAAIVNPRGFTAG